MTYEEVTLLWRAKQVRNKWWRSLNACWKAKRILTEMLERRK